MFAPFIWNYFTDAIEFWDITGSMPKKIFSISSLMLSMLDISGAHEVAKRIAPEESKLYWHIIAEIARIKADERNIDSGQ